MIRDARIDALLLAEEHDGVVIDLSIPRVVELRSDEVSLAHATQWYTDRLPGAVRRALPHRRPEVVRPARDRRRGRRRGRARDVQRGPRRARPPTPRRVAGQRPGRPRHRDTAATSRTASATPRPRRRPRGGRSTSRSPTTPTTTCSSSRSTATPPRRSSLPDVSESACPRAWTAWGRGAPASRAAGSPRASRAAAARARGRSRPRRGRWPAPPARRRSLRRSRCRG